MMPEHQEGADMRPLSALASGLLLLSSATASLAQEWPVKPVRVIVGAAAGSSGDVLGRLLAEPLGQLWKQSVVIDNRPGAGGVLASQAMLSAAPDGYTLMLSAGSYLVITPHTVANLPYDVDRDFTPIAMGGEIPLMLGVSARIKATNLRELIEHAKANPGKVEYAANTPGTFPHLATAYLLHSAGVEMTFVPYKGSAAALQDVMGGRIDMVVEGVSALAGALKGGTLRPLAVTSSKRLATHPDVPAAAELIPGYGAVGFFAMVGSSKLPEAIVKKAGVDINQVVARPEVVERMAALGIYPRAMSPAELAQFVRAERDVWGPVIKRMGFKPQ